MDDQILDHIDDPEKTYHYRKSKRYLLIAIGLIAVILFIFIVVDAVVLSIISAVSALLFFTAVIASFFGLIHGVMSFRKKETHSAVRIIVLIGNLIIFGMFMLALITNILDLIGIIY